VTTVEQTGPPCIIDLAQRWKLDAALFLALSAALLAWSIAVTSARAAAVAAVIAVGASLLADRFAGSLTDPAKLADQSTELPVGAYQETVGRYLVTAAIVLAVFVAVSLAVGLVLGTSAEGVAPLAGITAAIGINRLVGARRLRRLERERHIRLSARAGSVWRGRRTYYTRPDLGI
jgi:hypothetical protein